MAQATKTNVKYKNAFFYGEMQSANLPSNPTYIKSRGRYCYRIKCTFESGKVLTVQTKYHQTKEEALAMYPFYKQQAEEKRIPVFKCTVKEFQSFWRHALDYNKSYHSLIKKYIIPVLGDKRINDVTTDELIKILKETEIPDTQNFPMEKYSMLCDAVSSFFRNAMELYCAGQDNGTAAANAIRSSGLRIWDDSVSYDTSEAYSFQQLLQLLKISKWNAPTLYLPMLLSATAGLQIAEIVRIHFDDIDLDNHCLDLPRTHKDYNGPRSNIVLSRENTKTVYLPDIIMNEIKNQENRLKALQEQDPEFNPFRYLIWSQNGRQQQENFIKKPYERILSKCSFPAFPWRSFLKIRLTDKEIDELEDSLGYETPMNSGAYEIPIDKHDLMDLTGTTYF